MRGQQLTLCSGSGPAPSCPEPRPHIPPTSPGHRSQAGPRALTRGRGTRHPEELPQPCPPQPAAPLGADFAGRAPCRRAACPLPAHSTSIPLEKPPSFLFLPLSPRLSISPGSAGRHPYPHPNASSQEGRDGRGQHRGSRVPALPRAVAAMLKSKSRVGWALLTRQWGGL